jgi:hypothetical protein
MANNRMPGPIGTATTLSMVDNGTLSLAPSHPPAPLLCVHFTPSQPVAIALARLTTISQHLANRHLQNSLLQHQYLEECRRSIGSLTTLFQQTQISEKEAQHLIHKLSCDINSSLGLLGAGGLPAFYRLLTTIRGYTDRAQPLFNPAFIQLSDNEKVHRCTTLFHALSLSNQNISGSAGIQKNISWLCFLTACVVWVLDSGRMAKALSWQPDIFKARSYRPIGKKPASSPPPAARARPSAPPKPVEQESTQIDQNQQAKTLESAAKDGTPFCEECEKAKAKQKAESQSAA